jgi:hypothetical protein
VPSAALTTSLATIGFSFTYVSVLALLTLLVGGELPSILAVFIASATLALMLPPVARMLGRLLHWLDDDPTDLSAALARILAGAPSPSMMLAQMERLMAARLHIPAVEIAHDAAFPGSTATTDTRFSRIPLRLGVAGQGSLPVHHRHGQRRLTRREHSALAMASEPA